MIIMKNRKLIKPTDLIIIAAAIIVAAILGLLLYSGKGGTSCTISVDGNVVKNINLTNSVMHEFVLEQDPTVKFSVKDGAISFLGATCHDKLCENVGYISRFGQTAICLPKKVVLRIDSDKSEGIDIIVQ